MMRNIENDTQRSDISIYDVETPITLGICTNKLAQYGLNVEKNVRLLGKADRFICILEPSPRPPSEILDRLENASARVITNTKAEGLSHNRNLALRACQTRFLIFLDDDVTLTSAGLNALRRAAQSGAVVAGLRLVPPADLPLDRWFMTPCQWHYLALHRPDRPAGVWGACMLLDVEAVRHAGLEFQINLGRKGAQLQSGDDTTFIRRLQQPAVALDEPPATHHVATDRLRLGYLLRRAYWQGVSEFRRRSVVSGVRKEIRRNFDFQTPSVRRSILGVVFVGSVVFGAFSAWFGTFLESVDE